MTEIAERFRLSSSSFVIGWPLRMRLPPSSDGASEQIINKQNMADIGSSTNNNEEIISENTEKMDIAEPETKKRKVDVPEKNAEYKLEERLNGILCCAVCLDLPPQAVFQVRPKLVTVWLMV